uniref:WRKY family transcription factor n=1 Tax=Tanacetum cinerariifolium TaxID=118510 RepID=A0A6L2J7E5_TANCI|nr:WRKY family transcription factor [Tanacetum cinerariifolium]
MTDLGLPNYFLGIFVTRTTKGMFFCQKKYAIYVLEHVGMRNFHSCSTLVDTKSKLGADGTPVSDMTLYMSLSRNLQYLTFTRPDLSYAIQQVYLYMHDAQEPHFAALKRILRYVRDTLDYETSTLSRFSAEADYRGVANVHQRMKLIEIDIHFVRDQVFTGQIGKYDVKIIINREQRVFDGALRSKRRSDKILNGDRAGFEDVSKDSLGETPPPKQPIDKAYSIANIKAFHHHLDTPPTTITSTADPLHDSNDSLVVMWIYSTISSKLVEMIVDVDSTSHGVWKRLKDLFHDNKDARITQLDNEIRNMEIGSSSIIDFFQQIKSKADRHANLDSLVKDSSLMTYAINGIRIKYPEVARVVRLREKAPTFDELRSLMLFEEVTCLNHQMANTMNTSGIELCRNFQRGTCAYGARCNLSMAIMTLDHVLPWLERVLSTRP